MIVVLETAFPEVRAMQSFEEIASENHGKAEIKEDQDIGDEDYQAADSHQCDESYCQ